MDEADIFTDDDLDLLANDTILELERNAISSTQKQHLPQQQQLRRPKQAHNASSLTRSRSINTNIPWRPPQRLTQQAPASQDLPLSEHHSFDGEDVINLDEDVPVSGWSQTQKSAAHTKPPTAYTKARPAIDAEVAAAFAAADEELATTLKGPSRTVLRQDTTTSIDSSELERQARFAELEAKLEAAHRLIHEKQRQLDHKNGEIDIVRANAERERKEHDKRVQTLQRSYADEAAKHKAEVEAGRKEREKMQTDNRFLQHDLAQETERVRKLGAPRTRPERDTPRKARPSGHGDGFNDDEVRMYSPSRSREKPRDGTPRGAKRKRSAQDSPIQSLSFAKPSPAPREDSIDSAPAVPLTTTTSFLPRSDSEGDGLRFMQKLVDYQPPFETSRALEVLAQHQIDDKPVSSTLMQVLAMPRSGDDTLPLRAIRALGELWEVCLEEQTFETIRILVDIILFAMRLELPSRSNVLAEILVPLCLRTLEIVTMPIVRAHLKASYAASGEERAEEPSSLIDADQITELLLAICEACTLSPERITKFWQMMDFTSSMLFLHKALPMHRIMAALRILQTSALPTSFGALHEDSVSQEQQEKDTVYRLTFALFDVPTVPAGEPPYDIFEIAEFRILVLDILTVLCEHEHGSQLLARHAHFIGRLVRFLDEQIRMLYTLPVMPRQDDEDDPQDEHGLVVKTINMAMRILHHLLHEHGDHVDLSERFAVVTGGYHKFLIGMTRLAFIEQPTVFENGIEEDVIDAAHSILDAFLTPEDGEAVAQALETPQGSKSIRAPSHIDEDVMVID